MIKFPVKSKGQVHEVRVVHDDGQETIYAGCDNLILNSFLLSSDDHQYLQVGTGSTPPVVTDTTLESQIGSVGSRGALSVSNAVFADRIELSQIATFTFTKGAVVGNLAEYGLSTSSSPSGSVGTRALFKDGGGIPVTIPVTSADQLYITYKMTTVWPLGEVAAGTIDFNGTPIDYSLKSVWNTSYYGLPSEHFYGGASTSKWGVAYLCAAPNLPTYSADWRIPSSPAGQITTGSGAFTSYNTGTFTRHRGFIVPPTALNATGLKAFGCASAGADFSFTSLVLELATPINKLNTEEFQIEFGVTFSAG